MLLAALAAPIFCAQTDFKVKEYMGVSRADEPVSGGIALPKGAAASVSQLALFDGPTEVPAQFHPLVRYGDNSVQWVLVDFTAALAGNAEKTYTLKTQAASASASPAVSVSRSGSVITIANGVVSFSFDTVDFKGLESLVYNSKNLISGPGSVSAFDLVKGTPDTNGPVTSARFIYLGDTRATYRVEGTLYSGSCGGLGYAYTMTVYAGNPRVYIDATIRNSTNPTCGRLAKIRSAFAGFTLGFDPARTVAYDTIAGRPSYMYAFRADTIRSTRAFEDNSGTGLAVMEKWNGGNYENFLNRTMLNGRKLEVELVQPLDSIPPIFEYGEWRPSYCPGYVNDSAALAGYGAKYVYYLQDFSHITSQIILECYNNAVTEAGLRSKMLAAKHRLIPRQAAADVAASGGLSIGKFGTLEDEQACQAAWGWQACNPFPTGDAYHNSYKIQVMRGGTTRINKPDCAPWMDIESHYDIEMDYLQGWFVQWLRYGDRDYYDLAEAFGKFYANYYVFRTPGFNYDGQYSYWPGTRTEGVVPHPGIYQNSVYGMLNTTRVDMNWGGCHFFLTGLTDYYCLTGDPEALETCRDAFEIVKVCLVDHGSATGPVDTLNSSVALASRSINRKLNYWIRYYEITRDPSILPDLRNYVRGAMLSKNKDPYFWQKYPFKEASWAATNFGKYMLSDTLLRYMRENRLGIEQLKIDGHFDEYVMHDSVSGETWPVYNHAYWESYWLVDALENWLRLFPNDDDVRDYIIGYANYITWIKDGHCGLDNYEWVLSDFPRKGMHSPVYHQGTGTHNDTLFLIKWDKAHDSCAIRTRGSGGIPSSHGIWNNGLVLSVQTAGFRNTGFTYFKNQAERIWGLFSGNYPVPGPADQPGMYANIGEWEFFHNDRLTKVVPLFYEKIFHTDTTPPEAVTDLSVSRLSGNSGLAFSWNAPAGGPVSYQLKFIKDKPLADYPDFDYADFDTNLIPWWYAVNVEGEPVPGGAGAPEGFNVTGLFPTDSVYYAALCTRDTAGNLSRLSNLVRIDNTIRVEQWDPEAAQLSLCPFPNPFNPSVNLRMTLPRDGMRPVVSVFDAAGRLVWKAAPAAIGKKVVNVVWSGKNMAGLPAGSGVYFVRMAVSGKEINRKVIMVK